MTPAEFKAACQEAGIPLSDVQLAQFETYKNLLLEWNEKMNLTAITDPGQIWEKHFYDSIIPFAGMDMTSMCDVGTGAGFPGIPCKIAWPDLNLVLVEPLHKRCRFLEEVVGMLQLSDVEIVCARAEDFAKERRESFDLVTSRAVARMSILLELCAPLARVNGEIAALKGPAGFDELKQAAPAVKALGLDLVRTKQLKSEEGGRINFYFRKLKKTPSKYPRNFGQMKKKPLEETEWEKS